MSLALLAALNLPGLSGASTPGQTQTVEFLNFTSQAPIEWEKQAPSSSMRLAQFSIIGESSQPIQAVIYYFGPKGGSAEANIARWRLQFRTNNGSQPEAEIQETTVDNMKVTTAELSGSYARGIGAGPGGPGLPDHSLVAAIMESPAGNLIFQLWGPTDLVNAQRDNFLSLVKDTRKGH